MPGQSGQSAVLLLLLLIHKVTHSLRPECPHLRLLPPEHARYTYHHLYYDVCHHAASALQLHLPIDSLVPCVFTVNAFCGSLKAKQSSAIISSECSPFRWRKPLGRIYEFRSVWTRNFTKKAESEVRSEIHLDTLPEERQPAGLGPGSTSAPKPAHLRLIFLPAHQSCVVSPSLGVWDRVGSWAAWTQLLGITDGVEPGFGEKHYLDFAYFVDYWEL